MDNLNLNKHISGQFNAELEYIRTQVMTMGGLVEQQLSDAITAMHNQDSDLAKRVIDGDKQVNMMEVAIDEACVRIIAKRQPTASDLRLVMAIIKTIAELERIGDVADKICRTALEKFSQQHQPLLVSLESLGRHTVQIDVYKRQAVSCTFSPTVTPASTAATTCTSLRCRMSKRASRLSSTPYRCSCWLITLR